MNSICNVDKCQVNWLRQIQKKYICRNISRRNFVGNSTKFKKCCQWSLWDKYSFPSYQRAIHIALINILCVKSLRHHDIPFLRFKIQDYLPPVRGKNQQFSESLKVACYRKLTFCCVEWITVTFSVTCVSLWHAPWKH